MIHVLHAPYLAPGVVSVIVLGALLFYRDQFYAVGDPRTRWRALYVFAWLLVADLAIGLAYILLARGLARDYSVPAADCTRALRAGRGFRPGPVRAGEPQ